VNYILNISDTAKKQLMALKKDKGLSKHYNAVKKALILLQNNPKHPGLQTHIYHSLKGPNGEKIFEAYAEQHTPAAYRIFFCYGPRKDEISVVAIVPHPD